MWQNKFNGILGIWIIILAFIDFSDSARVFLLVITGVLAVFASFKSSSFVRSTKDLIKESQELEKKNGLEEKNEKE